MGSYGIGVSRIPAAILETSEKNDSILWPKKISPFDVMILNLSNQSDIVDTFCNKIYVNFKNKGFDILYDDRKERPGVKFSDSDLLGIPFILLIGRNYLKNKSVTLINKYLNEEFEINENEVENKIKELISIEHD